MRFVEAVRKRKRVSDDGTPDSTMTQSMVVPKEPSSTLCSILYDALQDYLVLDLCELIASYFFTAANVMPGFGVYLTPIAHEWVEMVVDPRRLASAIQGTPECQFMFQRLVCFPNTLTFLFRQTRTSRLIFVVRKRIAADKSGWSTLPQRLCGYTYLDDHGAVFKLRISIAESLAGDQCFLESTYDHTTVERRPSCFNSFPIGSSIRIGLCVTRHDACECVGSCVECFGLCVICCYEMKNDHMRDGINTGLVEAQLFGSETLAPKQKLRVCFRCFYDRALFPEPIVACGRPASLLVDAMHNLSILQSMHLTYGMPHFRPRLHKRYSYRSGPLSGISSLLESVRVATDALSYDTMVENHALHQIQCTGIDFCVHCHRSYCVHLIDRIATQSGQSTVDCLYCKRMGSCSETEK